MATPDFVLNEDYTYYVSITDPCVLKAGTFIRPIELQYLPKHVTEYWVGVNPGTMTYCYTRYGIIPLPNKILRKV